MRGRCNDLAGNLLIVAGMPRSGTTFLYHNLQKHPDLFLPFRKELEYFNLHHDRGSDWYRGFFRHMRPGQIACDVEPNYILCPEAIERIEAFTDGAKLVIAVRDPAEVALSLYAQYGTLSYRLPSFEKFLESYVLAKGGSSIHLRLRRDTLVSMLDAYREAFGETVLLYSFRLFKENPLRILQAIESFAGATPFFDHGRFDNIVINSVSRRNVKWLSSWLGRERVITAIRLLFPRRTIQWARTQFDRLSVTQKGSTPTCYTQRNMQVAMDVFADDRAALSRLFARSEIQLGSGIPFSPAPARACRNATTPKLIAARQR